MLKRICLAIVLAVLTYGAYELWTHRPQAGFEHLLKSVVRIDVWKANYQGGRKQLERSVGSGVIMTPQGHILTNAHVVSNQVEKLQVTLFNLERVEATFVGWDHWTDLAVIQLDQKVLEEKKCSFEHALFGKSQDLFLGEEVYAVGTPYGLERTVTKGVVSNPNRFFEGDTNPEGHEVGYLNNWIQTDAAINPGNSGGPLVLKNGRVVGINTRKNIFGENLSFAVPSMVAQGVMHLLIEKGEVPRSYIGITPRPIQELESFYEVEGSTGLLIENVDLGSPSHAAGLKPGDVILKMNGEVLDGRFPEKIPPILSNIASQPIGSTIELMVKSGKNIQKKAIITEKLESRVGSNAVFSTWGVSLQMLTKIVAREKKMTNPTGFVVLGLQNGFPASLSKLRVGDIILKVDAKILNDFESLRKVEATFLNQHKPVLLEVKRGIEILYVVLK